MVCDRCKRVVREELEKLSIVVLNVELGEVLIDSMPTGLTLDDVQLTLQKDGFDLINDRKQVVVEQMKVILINEIQHLRGERLPAENYSAFLERKVGYEYSHLSHLFSSSEGQTLEKYIIALKIEKVKEWLRYNELTLSEIAWRLSYSSVQHLSTQFRQVTGQTPSQFRKANGVERRNLDTI